MKEQLMEKQFAMTAVQKSAEGKVGGTGATEGLNKLRTEIMRKEKPDGTYRTT